MTITREQVMEFFRSEEYIEALSMDDKYDIALTCLSFSDELCTNVETLIDNFELDNPVNIEVTVLNHTSWKDEIL